MHSVSFTSEYTEGTVAGLDLLTQALTYYLKALTYYLKALTYYLKALT
jgi:hypothetical protein